MVFKHYLNSKKLKSIPAEHKSPLWLGLCIHFGPVAVLGIILINSDLTLIEIAWAFLTVSMLNLVTILVIERIIPDTPLLQASIQEWVRGMSLVFFKGVFCGTLVVLGIWWMVYSTTAFEQRQLNIWLIVLAVLLTDFSYYWIHRLLNHGRQHNGICRWYRKMHRVHHGVQKLDFLRGNVSSFFDTAVTGFQLPLAIIACVFGLTIEATLIAYSYVLLLQATHHANFTFNIGILRFLFMDNHAHKMHHCPRGYLVNHGALFSIWDQAFGTFYENWNLSAGYMHKHHCALPIKPIK